MMPFISIFTFKVDRNFFPLTKRILLLLRGHKSTPPLSILLLSNYQFRFSTNYSICCTIILLFEYSYFRAKFYHLGINDTNSLKSKFLEVCKDKVIRLLNLGKYIYCILSFNFQKLISFKNLGCSSILFESFASIKYVCKDGC